MSGKSSKRCCVPKCGSANEILHRFPNPDKEPERFKTWIHNIGEPFVGMDNATIYKCRRVCHLHFETRDHTRSKYLCRDAVPLLSLPNFGLIGRPSLLDVTKQTTSSTAAEIHHSRIPQAVEIHQSSIHQAAEIHQSRIPQAVEINQAAEIHQLRIPQAVEIHQSRIHQAAEIHQSRIPQAVEIFQSRIHQASEVHQSSIYQFSDQELLDEQSQLSLKAVPCIERSTPKQIISNEKCLLNEIKKLKAKNDFYKMRLKKAMKLSTNTTFQKALSKFNKLAAMFTVMQFRTVNKPKVGHRFSTEEKLFALRMYKMGPTTYRWLSNIFILPSVITLQRIKA